MEEAGEYQIPNSAKSEQPKEEKKAAHVQKSVAEMVYEKEQEDGNVQPTEAKEAEKLVDNPELNQNQT